MDFLIDAFSSFGVRAAAALGGFLVLFALIYWIRRRRGRRPANRGLAPRFDASMLGRGIDYIFPGAAGSIATAATAVTGAGANWSLPALFSIGIFVVPGSGGPPPQPVWNAWAESRGAPPGDPMPLSFKPTKLAPSQDYAVVIDLAAMKYETGLTAFPLVSAGTSKNFIRWIDENPDADAADVTLVALADPDYFTMPDGNVKTLHVDLKKIRTAKRDGVSIPFPWSPLDELRSHNGDTPFSFGLQSFAVHTGERAGAGNIGISIWAEGKPIDELKLTLCIEGPGAPSCQSTLSASQYAGVDLSMRTAYPDLALHLFQDGQSVKGVLRCNTCNWADDDYPRWDLKMNTDSVANRIKNITDAIGAVSGRGVGLEAARPEIEHAGDDLYNLIFDVPKPSDKAIAAFARFMTRAQAADKDNKPPPSLFVRIIPDKPELTLAPIGLMHARSEKGDADFVGFVANVQTPLESQYYSENKACLRQWTLFVPPESPKGGGLGEVQLAREPFENWIDTFRKNCADCVIEDPDAFHNWLNSKPKQPEARAVAILSHHAANTLYFDANKKRPRVLSTALARHFDNPSFVLLNACGTSEPGASDFIERFNSHGMNTVIATSTLVDPVLAGKFLTVFMDELKAHASDQGYTASRARFDAVRTLGRDAASAYGPKALAFILAGNGAIRLCVPEK